MKRWFGLGAAALALAACSYGYGVMRTGGVDAVDYGCVESALRAADGVEVIEAKDQELKSAGLDLKDTSYRGRNFVYRAPGVDMAGLSFGQQAGKPGYKVQHVWGSQDKKKLTPEAVSVAVRTMLRVEQAVKAACNLELALQTSCSGIDCKPVETIVKELTGA